MFSDGELVTESHNAGTVYTPSLPLFSIKHSSVHCFWCSQLFWWLHIFKWNAFQSVRCDMSTVCATQVGGSAVISYLVFILNSIFTELTLLKWIDCLLFLCQEGDIIAVRKEQLKRLNSQYGLRYWESSTCYCLVHGRGWHTWSHPLMPWR